MTDRGDEEARSLLRSVASFATDVDHVLHEALDDRRRAVRDAIYVRPPDVRARLRPALQRLRDDRSVDLGTWLALDQPLDDDELRGLLDLVLTTPWPPYVAPTPPAREVRAEPVPRRCPRCGGPLDYRRTTATSAMFVEASCLVDGFHDAWSGLDERGPDWWQVPAGRFTLGLTDDEVARLVAARDDDDDALHGLRRPTRRAADTARPAHDVDLDAFEIQARPVTRAAYARFAIATGRPVPDGDDDAPVVGITWRDAARYAVWIGGALPTEAQWERFARGAAGHRFAATFDDDAPIEWCWDPFGPYPGPTPSTTRVRRGGAVMGLPPCPALRDGADPDHANVATTFRCVRPAIRAVTVRGVTYRADDDWETWLRDHVTRPHVFTGERDDLDVRAAMSEVESWFEGTALVAALAAARRALVEAGDIG